MNCIQCNSPTRLISDTSTYLGCIPFRDEKGITHLHDTNRKVRTYKCDNNHIIEDVLPNTCWCGWNSSQIFQD